ncbi:MAG: hypothetical protein WKG07_32110 [Hymenobacter sp.]
MQVSHRELGELTWYLNDPAELLFCDNHTNVQRLDGHPSGEQFYKDGIN